MKTIFTSIFFCLLLHALTGCAAIKIQSASSDSQAFYLNHKHGDEISIKKQLTVDFYLWGLLPSKRSVYIEDHYRGEGLISASGVEVKIQRSFMSYLLTFVTLGVYYPVDLELAVYAKRSDSRDLQFSHPILETMENTP